ncbi:hypothetical protein Tcan_06326 [Toxocara canis]|uniref:Uncharacterized protein n=1 Tax=Toxocara canis TaxID=6265 RepID=A0A0B2VCJ6_TOXCA|nr:hypothetical protein Tcan_06326 [Toxocara canis]
MKNRSTENIVIPGFRDRDFAITVFIHRAQLTTANELEPSREIKNTSGNSGNATGVNHLCATRECLMYRCAVALMATPTTSPVAIVIRREELMASAADPNSAPIRRHYMNENAETQSHLLVAFSQKFAETA